jgi:hypothetical protein
LQGLYALVYDINTANETWEWVDFKEVHDHFLCGHSDNSSHFCTSRCFIVFNVGPRKTICVVNFFRCKHDGEYDYMVMQD